MAFGQFCRRDDFVVVDCLLSQIKQHLLSIFECLMLFVLTSWWIGFPGNRIISQVDICINGRIDRDRSANKKWKQCSLKVCGGEPWDGGSSFFLPWTNRTERKEMTCKGRGLFLPSHLSAFSDIPPFPTPRTQEHTHEHTQYLREDGLCAFETLWGPENEEAAFPGEGKKVTGDGREGLPAH